MHNLFTPGFAQIPEVFTGRDGELSFVSNVATTAISTTPNPVMLYGPRGMGKTVLLHHIGRLLAREGWKVYFAEASHDTFLEYTDPAAWQASSMSAEVTVPFFKLSSKFDKIPVTSLLTQIDTTLVQEPVALLIDELHLIKQDDLKALGAWLQAAIRAHKSIFFIGAGLPGLLSPKKTVSYFERAFWKEILHLSTLDSLTFLDETFTKSGKTITLAELNVIAQAANGYPYALQMYGYYIWMTSRSSYITEEDVHMGITAANKDMKSSLFQHRWFDASPSEREYMSTLATLHIERQQEITHADIARYLDKEPKKLSYILDSLTKKGTITKTGSHLNFLIPIMNEWALPEE